MFSSRDKLEADILADSRDLRTDVVTGVLGSGKSTLLQKLAKSSRDFRTEQPLSLERFDPGHQGDVGERASVGAVQASFQQFVALLRALLQQYARDGLPRFEHAVIAARNKEVTGLAITAIDDQMLEDSIDELGGPLQPRALADAWRAAARSVSECFVELWNTSHSGQARLLLLDDMDTVDRQELGSWLWELFPKLQRTVVVAAAEADEESPAADTPSSSNDGAPSTVHRLGKFEKSEVIEFLTSKKVPLVLAEQVYRVSDGHPATLAVIYELLWGRSASADVEPESILSQLSHLPNNEQIAVVVERLVEKQDGEQLRKAFAAAAVPRRFDADLLRHLLKPLSLSPDQHASVFDQLSRQRDFVEDLSVEEKDQPARRQFRLRRYVRKALLTRMVQVHSNEFAKLNRSAADYYNDLLVNYSSPTAEYSQASAYEDPTWQSYKREWLYHRGLAASSNDKDEALVEFATVFLDAFWWWGNYVHFDFCDIILADLDQLVVYRGGSSSVAPWPELGRLARALRRILKEYPPRSIKPPDADWQGVQDALVAVRMECHLDRGGPDEKRKKLSALLAIFLAHSWRYRPAGGHRAEEYYREALDLLDDPWDTAWVLYELADLHFERSGPDGVRGEWSNAAAIAQNAAVGDAYHDDELASNLHRLRADCSWIDGDRHRAATWYGRAVLHAYLFHLAGPAPDEYTKQFYVDILARAVNRLSSMAGAEHRAEAINCAVEMARAMPPIHSNAPSAAQVLREQIEDNPVPPEVADTVGRLLEAGTPIKLSHQLFPEGPKIEELHDSESSFVQACRQYLEAVRRTSVHQDLLLDQAWP